MNRGRIFIFDSPDGTGKTNIAQGLSKVIGVPYFKFNREHDYWRKNQFKTALEFDQPYLLQFLQQTLTDVIIDRAYPAEWVYSQVFKRETNYDLIDEIDSAYAGLGAWIIMPLRADYSDNRDDEVVPNEKLDELHARYNTFADWTECNVIRIYVDSYGNDLKRELQALMGVLDSIPNLDPDTKHNIILRNQQA